MASGDLIGGLIQGITGKVGDLGSSLSGAVTGVVAKLGGVFGHSPSPLVAEKGKNMIHGLVAGITGNQTAFATALSGLGTVAAPALGAAFAQTAGPLPSFGGGGGSPLGAESSTDARLAEITDLLRTREPITVHQGIHTADPTLTARETVEQLRAAQFRSTR